MIRPIRIANDVFSRVTKTFDTSNQKPQRSVSFKGACSLQRLQHRASQTFNEKGFSRRVFPRGNGGGGESPPERCTFFML